MKYTVICSTDELNVSITFNSYAKARAFSQGFKKGIQLWDMEMELNIDNFTHRGFRFGQIMGYYCERHYLSPSILKSFVEVCDDEELDGRIDD